MNYFQKKSEYIYLLITWIGLDYRYKGETQTSLEYFYKLLEQTPKDDTYRYGKALNHIGVSYIILEDYDKALQYCEQALEYYKIENKIYRMGNIYNDLARIYFLTGNFQKALEYNFTSLNNRKKLNLTRLVASSYRNIADNFLDLKKYDNSEKYYLKSIEEAEKINDPNLLQYVYEKLTKLYEEQQRYKQALLSYKRYLQLYMIHYDQELQTKMLNEQYNMEITNIEQENSLLKKTNTNLNQEVLKTKKISSSLMYGLILALVTLIFAIIIYYDKKKYSSKLEREVAEKTKELNNS